MFSINIFYGCYGKRFSTRLNYSNTLELVNEPDVITKTIYSSEKHEMIVRNDKSILMVKIPVSKILLRGCMFKVC